jgi:hypothetical protein
MRIGSWVAIATLILSGQVHAAELPTGHFKATSFVVEKGTLKMTDKDLHAWTAAVTIRKRGDGGYDFTLSAKMQRSESTPMKTDRRYDVFDVKWESANSGTLMNRNSEYSGDTTTFTISKSELVIKSWIARNRLWETHIYSLAK